MSAEHQAGPSSGAPSERVYTAVRAAIMHGSFAPDQALKPQEIAQNAGVSLAVAREALLRLVGEGMAVRLPNRGFAVPAAGAERWQQIAEARAVTEPAILRLSIARGGVDWEVRVRAAHHRLARTPAWIPDQTHFSDEWAEAHRQFHRALLDGCGNTVLLETFDRMWTASELARRWSGQIAPERDGTTEHAALEAAALDRDADHAAELLSRHITLTAQALATSHAEPGT
jgi:DNA-binding GntR family transcriptional regulator